MLVVISAAILAAALFVVSDGLFVVDELVYYMTADAFGRGQSLTVENGWEVVRHPILTVANFLIQGPNGLAPQYPPGSAFLNGAIVAEMGPRGMIVTNAVCAVALLFLTRALAWRLFADARIAAFAPILLLIGTFFTEYAFGVWPHMPSTLTITAAIYAAVRSIQAQSPRTTVLWSVAWGLAVGVGLLFRTDSVLALGPLVALVILAAPRPVASLIGGAVGLLPSAVLMAAVNAHKFGTWNPLTYGRPGTGGDPTTHLPLIFLAVAGLGALILLRLTPPRSRPLVIGAGLVAAVGAVLIVPAAEAMALKLWAGVQGYMLDVRLLPDSSPGVTRDDGGFVRIWGSPKVALGQSIPWLGIFTALPAFAFIPRARLPALVFVLVASGWALPLSMLSWHGGFGHNMRYYWPILPVASILGTAVFLWLADAARIQARTALLAGLAILVAALAFARFGPGGALGGEQTLGVWLLAGVAVASLIGSLPGPARRARTTVAAHMAVAGFVLAGFHAVGDMAGAQNRRVQMAETAVAFERDMKTPAVAYDLPTRFGSLVGNPGGFLAYGPPDDLDRIVAAGLNLYVAERHLDQILNENPGLEATGDRIDLPGGAMIRVEEVRLPQETSGLVAQ